MSEEMTAGQIANTLVSPHAHALGPVLVARLSEDIAAAIREAELAALPKGRAAERDCILAELNAGVLGVGPASIKAPSGHILDDAGNVRKVLGTLPLTADGCVVGLNADMWYRPLGNRTVRAIRLQTSPVLTGFLDGIPGSPLYEFFPQAEFSTYEAALAASPPSGGSSNV